MFLFKNASCECVMGIVVFYRYNSLKNDNTVVNSLVNEVDGAAGELSPVIKRLALSIEAGKRWQQRRVNIEDAIREGLHKCGRDNTHITSKANKIDIMVGKCRDHLSIVRDAVLPFEGMAIAVRP